MSTLDVAVGVFLGGCGVWVVVLLSLLSALRSFPAEEAEERLRAWLWDILHS